MEGPSGSPEPAPRVQRLIGFSDAVVAIAATLLVVPLVEIVPDMDVENVGDLLADNTNNFVAFAVSFVVIYRFWLTHHHTFGNAAELTGPLVWLNGLWLLSIAFLPFPTQLVGSQDTGSRLANGLYIGTMLMTSISGVAGQWLVRRERGANDLQGLAPGLILVGLMTLALVIAVSVPQIGLWALLLLFGSPVMSGWVRRRR